MSNLFCMLNFILLQVCMVLQNVVLYLDISFDFTNVSFGITLSFISEVSNLFIEIFLNSLLQGNQILFTLFSHFLKLFLKFEESFLLSSQYIFILFVSIFEMSQLIDIICQNSHGFFSLMNVIILLFPDLIYLCTVPIL